MLKFEKKIRRQKVKKFQLVNGVKGNVYLLFCESYETLNVGKKQLFWGAFLQVSKMTFYLPHVCPQISAWLNIGQISVKFRIEDLKKTL